MRRLLWIFWAILIVCVAIFAWFAHIGWQEETRFAEAKGFRTRLVLLTKELATEPGSQVRAPLAELHTGPWDRLHVLGPYTAPENARKQLDPRWRSRRLERLSQSDNHYLIIFLTEGRVRGEVDIPRALVLDWETSGLEEEFTRNDTLVLTRTDSGGVQASIE